MATATLPPPLLLVTVVLVLPLLAKSTGTGIEEVKQVVLRRREEALSAGCHGIELGKSYIPSSIGLVSADDRHGLGAGAQMEWTDCAQLYDDGDYLLRLITGEEVDPSDALAWIIAALTNHRTCLDGLVEKGVPVPELAENVTSLLRGALVASALPVEAKTNSSIPMEYLQHQNGDMDHLLASWHPSHTRKADVIVANDGTGHHKSINEAVTALARRSRRVQRRVVIYVKAGVYEENVEIGRELRDVMFVGDGMGKTVVTGRRNVPDGSTTFKSATFGVSGDGFWARDMTFENTAGPQKEQAVALRSGSDSSVFYRCSFVGYQDTLFVFSGRQFYRDCLIYGTIDFIFGNAAAVLQRCTILVRRPMPQQSIMITAQGRDDLNDRTGISVHESRIVLARDLRGAEGRFKTFLGRPWKKYSRAVFLKSDLDGVVHHKGWAQWRGKFALNTLYYGEYMNYGKGAATGGRVKWGGFHILRSAAQAQPFTVRNFIQGPRWLPRTGVPFSPGL